MSVLYDRSWSWLRNIYTSTINSKKVLSFDGWGYGHMQQIAHGRNLSASFSSSQFSSQLYIPPSFSFSSRNMFDPTQTSAYPQRRCQYPGDVLPYVKPCTPSFETPTIPFIFLPTRVRPCFVFLTFEDFTSGGRSSGSTSSHISCIHCRMRCLLACLLASNLVTTTQKCVLLLLSHNMFSIWHFAQSADTNFATGGGRSDVPLTCINNHHWQISTPRKCCNRFNETDECSLSHDVDASSDCCGAIWGALKFQYLKKKLQENWVREETKGGKSESQSWKFPNSTYMINHHNRYDETDKPLLHKNIATG